MKSSQPVTILIPNYNGEKFISESLLAVQKSAQNYNGDVEILVVDDASTDNSRKIISSRHPKVKIYKHKVNKGFAEAVHTGVLKSTYEYIILLNSDVRPEPNFIFPLIQTLKKESVFSVSPLIINETGRRLPNSRILATIRHGSIKKIKDPKFVELLAAGMPKKTLYASGGSMAFNRKKFLFLDGFNPCFKPFGAEDTDLGIRAWRHGWMNLVEPASVIVHDSSQGTIKNEFNINYRKIQQRKNRYLLNWIHLSIKDLFVFHVPAIIIEVLWRSIKLDTTCVLGLKEAIKRIHYVVKARKKLSTKTYPLKLKKVLIKVRDFC